VRIAYVDTSCLVALAFGEPGSRSLAARLEGYDELLSSNLLEAELLAALAREGVAAEPELLSGIGWVLPDRSLGPELRRVLAAGRARGADAWHLAAALYLSDDPLELPFVTLDRRQGELAGALGFPAE
jgi:predicted nucleic acid-binding protein